MLKQNGNRVNMVKQIGGMKTLSKDWKLKYRFPSYIVGGCYLPASTTVEQDSKDEDGYTISGTLLTSNGLVGEENQDQWPEPPHLAFANLRVEDPRAAEAFIKRYGLLYGTGKSRLDFYDRLVTRSAPVRTRFQLRKSDLVEYQLVLQSAWEGDSLHINSLEFQVEEDTAVDIDVRYGYVQLRTENLFTFISFLFLFDYQKLAICGNDACPAPYFKKKRTTQKFCEAGPCVAHAQRQYSLDWWNREGKKRRDKRKAKDR
jgi:hypothetical protein